jgi:phosphoribosylanthranilate isomerase
VDAVTAREIVAQLPQQVERVGVFVDLSQDDLVRTVNEVGLTAMQCRLRRTAASSPEGNSAERFHGPVRRLVPLSVTSLLQDENRLKGLMADFARMADEQSRSGKRKASNSFDTFLLDSSTAQHPGGTGNAFDWERISPLVEIMKKSAKVVVAGGLTPDNVAVAMRILHPWGVDVSSGVEVTPGKKDAGKVRAFVQAVRVAG